MDDLIIEATKYTPSINLNAKTGIFSIAGDSYPENTFDFYQPVLDWINKYFKTSAQEITTLHFEVIYYNSSTSKLFFDLFDLLEEVEQQHKLVINWIFDEGNESAEEAGQDFIEYFESLKINLVKK